MAYVEVKGYGDLQPGDQIARIGRFEDLHASLKTLYVVVSDSPYYFHHGIYMGNYEVVHFYGETESDAKPRVDDLKEFDNGVGRKLFRVDYEGVDAFPPDKTIRMAKELISNTDDKSKWPAYSVLWNNCETFATYLKTGVKQSIQASEALFHSAVVVVKGSIVGIGVGASIGAGLASGR